MIEPAPNQCSPSLAQLRLMQLISPSLPIGGFTYSQGLEWAVEQDWITTADTLAQWLEELAETTLAQIDLPILQRLYTASAHQDSAALDRWNQRLLAYRETAEMRAEERQRGRALATLLRALKVPLAEPWYSQLSGSHLTGFAHAARIWDISPRNMMLGYVWSWLENLVLAGIKLIPLGQSAGQQILLSLTPKLPPLVENALHLDDTAIGASNPALAIASSQHQFQYTRLFRS